MLPPTTVHDRPEPPKDPLQAGRAALARGEWDSARAALDAAVARDSSDPSAWESLAIACMWLQDTEAVLTARQRAYALYRERGDDRSAARLCLDLVGDFLDVLGEPAVANGWFQRAQRLLDGLPPSREHALVSIWKAYLALNGAGGPVTAEVHAREAVAISEAAGTEDTAILGRALRGLALVGQGAVRDGMALLDEAVAAALGGELTDLQAVCLTCCCMIDACEQVRDYGRSMQWCERLRDLSGRWRVQSFLTTCRIKYSGVLLWRGEWVAAEAELQRALEDLSAATPAAASGVLVRLAELRRRQGRRREAEALLGRAGAHPLALTVRAAISCDADDPATAVDLLNVALRRTPTSARVERVPALELRARAHAALGQLERAEADAAELDEITTLIDTQPLQAAALSARGLVAAAGADHERARHCFEDATYLFEAAGSPHESARARIGLAGALAALGREEAAASEAAAALAVLEPLGAAVEARRVRKLLEHVRTPLARDPEPAGGWSRRPAATLTPRQQEVLSLVAQGLSDREVAGRLYISEYTVHRHVSNILTRLGVTSRTGAVSQALRSNLL